MHWHCVLNTPPHPQDTFYIAINSAIVAAGNKERRKSPPPSCVFYPCALFLGSTNLPRCWVRERQNWDGVGDRGEV